MLLYFREIFFFFFHTFTIFFLFKSVVGFSNITGYPTGSFQDCPIVGRETLYYPVVLCFSGIWYACYSKAAGLHGDQPHFTQMGPAYPVYDLPLLQLSSLSDPLTLEHGLPFRIVGFASCHSSFYTSSFSKEFSKL